MNHAIEVNNITKLFGSQRAVSGVDFKLEKGEVFGFLGPNGAGKTTILKLIMGQLKAKEGSIYIGPSVKPAYFDQEHKNLDGRNTVLNEVLNAYDLDVEEARGQLARYLFFAEDIEKRVDSLSGGEQGRLSLLKLTLEKGNFLLLDEPTNHLDIQTRELMEAYLEEYPGTLVMVSHDRYFIDTLADRVLELTPEGLVSYPGNYSDYKERKTRLEMAGRRGIAKEADKAAHTQAPVAEGAEKPKKAMDRYARARLRQRLQTLEDEITGLEDQEHAAIEALSNPETYGKDDAAMIKDLQEHLANIQARLPQAYHEWEDAGREMEEG
ncbi:MAG: ATP-binding cassette domain-containing protein [Clostridiales bacterium]|nr:ATP-binding cassette domain-containing protein [Clostridiales bacterium]